MGRSRTTHNHNRASTPNDRQKLPTRLKTTTKIQKLNDVHPWFDPSDQNRTACQIARPTFATLAAPVTSLCKICPTDRLPGSTHHRGLASLTTSSQPSRPRRLCRQHQQDHPALAACPRPPKCFGCHPAAPSHYTIMAGCRVCKCRSGRLATAVGWVSQRAMRTTQITSPSMAM